MQSPVKINISAPIEKNVVRMDETDETVFVRSVRRLSTVLGAPQPGKLISFFRAATFLLRWPLPRVIRVYRVLVRGA